MKLIYCLMAATMISLSANAQDGEKKRKEIDYYHFRL